MPIAFLNFGKWIYGDRPYNKVAYRKKCDRSIPMHGKLYHGASSWSEAATCEKSLGTKIQVDVIRAAQRVE